MIDVYLACPYSKHEDEVRKRLIKEVTEVAANLSAEGIAVFSPINHGDDMVKLGIPSDFSFWEKIDYKFLSCSRCLLIYMADGWEESVGVQAEITKAKELRIPVCMGVTNFWKFWGSK